MRSEVILACCVAAIGAGLLLHLLNHVLGG